jgi:hypothetical protein
MSLGLCLALLNSLMLCKGETPAYSLTITLLGLEQCLVVWAFLEHTLWPYSRMHTATTNPLSLFIPSSTSFLTAVSFLLPSDFPLISSSYHSLRFALPLCSMLGT